MTLPHWVTPNVAAPCHKCGKYDEPCHVVNMCEFYCADCCKECNQIKEQM